MIRRSLGFLRRHLPETVVLAAVCALCAPFLFGGRVIYWGLPLLQFYPWRWLAREMVAGGFLPLWNPHLGMGAPLLANAQSALLYPPNWLMLIAPIEHAQGWLMAAHLAFAGWGMARLARTLGLGGFGQTIAALAYALSGYLVARAWFLTINAAVAWLPWIVAAGEDVARRSGRAAAVRLGILLAMQWLAGHWQTAWYTAIFLAGWVTVRAWSGRVNWRVLFAAWADLSLAVVLALGLAAAQVLPSFEYWRESQRAGGVDPSSAYDYSFWPWRLVGFLAPYFFGHPARGDFWGYANFWEDAVYIGLLPLLLAGCALVKRVRGGAPAGLPYGFLAGVLPVALILAMGTWTPVFPFLAEHLPTFDFFQAPARLSLLAVFPLALLAGAGAECWRKGAGDERWTIRAAMACGALVAGGLLGPGLAPIPPSFGSAVAGAGAVGLAICALQYSWRSNSLQRTGAIWPLAAVAVVAVDLLAAGWGLIPSADPAVYHPSPTAPFFRELLGGRRMYMPEPLRYRLTYERLFRFDGFFAGADAPLARAHFLPNLAVADGIDTANNFDPFIPARYATLMQRMDALPRDEQERMLSWMHVGALWTAEGETQSLAPGPGRAWGVCRAEWVTTSEEALARVLAPEFDARRMAVLETGAGAEGGDCAGAMAVRVAESPDPNRVRVDVAFPQDGYLVLADVHYPGWSALLDGEPAPLLQADYLFRAVRVPAGTHSVEFEYTPAAFWAGLAVSVSAAAVLLGWFLWRRIAALRRR